MAVGARRRDINKSAVLPALEEVRRVQAVRAEAADDDLDAVHHPVDDARRRGVALRPDAGEEGQALRPAQLPHDRRRLVPVSYTHLTLPTKA